MARSTDGGSKQPPPVKTLRALLARTMVGKTADALDAVVGAVRDAAGDCSLAAATAREAMREALDLSLPADAGGGSRSVETLKSELAAVGVPPALLAAAFDGQDGPRPWAEVDAALVASHVGLMLSLEELGKLGHSIADRKVLVYGTSGTFVVGGGGGHRKCVQRGCLTCVCARATRARARGEQGACCLRL